VVTPSTAITASAVSAAPPTAPTTAAAPTPTTTVETTASGSDDQAVAVAPRTAWNGVLPEGGVPASTSSSVPVALRVAALGIDAPIVPSGTAADDGGLDLADDTTSVAWFRDGPQPGASGSAVLAAHVDHDGAEGVFFRLDGLPTGSPVEVDFADGSTLAFVTTSEAVRLPKASLPIDEVFRRGGPAVLTLVTCGGRFDRTARSYEDNTIVTAIPV
jgi:hypothetical protein